MASTSTSSSSEPKVSVMDLSTKAVSSVTDSITTNSELHWQMHQTYKTKLRERLLNYCDTKNLHESVLDRKIEDFLYVLCEISFTAIVNNDINITPQVYETLLKKCEQIQIPTEVTEDMFAALLKLSQSDTDEIHHISHQKEIIDSKSSLHIHKHLDPLSNFDIDQIQQRFANDLAYSNAPEDLCKDIMECFENYKRPGGSSTLRKKLRGKNLSLWSDYSSTSPAATIFKESDVIDEIKEILPSCDTYQGVWSAKLQIHSGMKNLGVRPVDSASCDAFIASLTTATMLRILYICFEADVSPTITNIPEWVEKFWLDFPDVKTKEDRRRASDIIRRFHTSFHVIYFPRCRLGGEDMVRLLDSLTGVTVTYGIFFPENLHPDDLDKVSGLEKKAKALGCEHGIIWYHFNEWNQTDDDMMFE